MQCSRHRSFRIVVVATALAASMTSAFAQDVPRPDATTTPPPRPMTGMGTTVNPLAAPALVFTVDVKWLGASSYRLERDITSKIERAVKTLPGVKEVHSTGQGSRAQTRISFDPKADASSTASAIRSRLDQIKTQLPRDASQPLIAWHREPAG